MSEPSLRQSFDRIQRLALGGAVVLGALVAYGYSVDRAAFFQGWLVGFVFWLALPLGSLALVMLHHMTGGSWGLAIRRLLEASMRTLPLFVLVFVPVVLGMDELYQWTDAEVVAHDAVLSHKAPYLNKPFFLLRAGVFFALWIGLALLLNGMSNRYDRTGDRAQVRRMRAVAGPGVVIYGLGVTFASVDWVMSLEAHWFSTIYGAMFMVGQALTTMAFAIAAAAWLSRREPFSRWLNPGHFHDLGKLLFAFVMLWAYVAYSQYLIIWMGNLAEETPWYAHRTAHGWELVGMALVALHFALPFLVLLSRKIKRNPRMLATVALALLGLRLLDHFWLILPAFHPEALTIHWLHVAAPAAIGALWFAVFVGQLKGRPLISLQDASLEESLEVLPEGGA